MSSQARESDRLHGVRILVVDDNEDARELLAMALSADGAAVFAAENGARAIPLMYTERPEVVVTDLSMPVMDGYETLKATKEILGVPCIAVTAFAFEHDRRASMVAGFDGHCAKPVDYRALVDRILELLASRAPRSSGAVAHETSGVRRKPNKRRVRRTG